MFNKKRDVDLFNIISTGLNDFNCNIITNQNKKTFKYVVNINTYNRKYSLTSLLKQIEEYNIDDILINIFDDCGDVNLFKYLKTFNLNIKYFRTNYNYHKKEYWKIWDFMIKFNSIINSKYFFFLPDDIILKSNFFNNVEKVWNNIKEEKICLSFGCDDNRKFETGCWTGFKPIIKNKKYIKTQFNDLLFMCDSKFFDALCYKIKFVKMKSSGVGCYISQTLSKKYNLFHTYENYVIHDVHESKMRPKSTRLKNHKRLIIL